MIINHTMSAINENQVLEYRQQGLDLVITKLSSGTIINNAVDDSSSFTVMELLP